MVNTNEKGEIIPHAKSFKIPILNVLRDGIDWNTNTELDLGYLRRSLYASGIASGKHIEHNHVFLSQELELARLRSNIVKYKQKDVTVTMIWGDLKDFHKIYIETCLYSELDEFIEQYRKQFKDRFTKIVYSSETQQVFIDNQLYHDAKPNYPLHDNPKGAKKRQQKRELAKAKDEEMAKPIKYPLNHKKDDPNCICEICRNERALRGD